MNDRHIKIANRLVTYSLSHKAAQDATGARLRSRTQEMTEVTEPDRVGEWVRTDEVVSVIDALEVRRAELEEAVRLCVVRLHDVMMACKDVTNWDFVRDIANEALGDGHERHS